MRIHVAWDQISGASVIVESGFKDFNVTSSQGSHFFHNITLFKIAYFTVDCINNDCFIDWEWLSEQEHVEEDKFTRHLSFDKPLIVKVSSQKCMGIILKPN